MKNGNESNCVTIKIDNLGRLLIPKIFRDAIGINGEIPLSIKLVDNYIRIEKYSEDIFKNIFNFAKIWTGKYANHTILVTNNAKVLDIFGYKRSIFTTKTINNEIFNIVTNHDFSYLHLDSYNLFYDCQDENCNVFSLRYYNVSVGSMIIIGDSLNKDNDLIFNIINKFLMGGNNG